MSTTLSDEEFQRINEQLVDLKNQKYNLETKLNRLEAENVSLRGEVENFKKLDSTNQSPSSIKHKLNPFALAKTIVNKVDTRLHSPSSQSMGHPTGSPTPLSNQIDNENKILPLPSSTEDFIDQFKLQELDFVKSNKMLKTEIALLQKQLKEFQEAENHPKINELTQPELLNQKLNQVSAENSDLQCISILKEIVSTGPSLKSNENEVLDYNSIVDKLITLSSVEASDFINANIDSIVNISSNGQYLEKIFKSNQTDFKKCCQSLIDFYRLQMLKLGKIVTLECEKILDLVQSSKKFDFKLNENTQKFQKMIDSLVNEKKTLEEQLTVLSKQLNDMQSSNNKSLEEQETHYSDLLDKVHQDYQIKIDSLTNDNSHLISDLEKQIDFLQNTISESVNEKKISEKRGFKIIKELKKQLNVERNRADKLQSILNNEIDLQDGELVEPSNRLPFDSTITAIRSATATTCFSDKCSSSESWSYMNDPATYISPPSNNNNNVNTVKPPSHDAEFSDFEICDVQTNNNNNNGNGNSMTPNLEQENVQLLARVALLQQEKWRLHERVNQMEGEIYRLSKIVSHNDSTIIRSKSPEEQLMRSSSISSLSSSKPSVAINNSVMKIVNYIREKSESVGQQNVYSQSKQINDANRKLQRMVEEILTKNMHLQANLEELSNELMSVKSRLLAYERKYGSIS